MVHASQTTRPVSDWRKRRQDVGLTVTQLAERSALPAPYISQIESGRMFPALAEAEAIIAACDAAELEKLEGLR